MRDWRLEIGRISNLQSLFYRADYNKGQTMVNRPNQTPQLSENLRGFSKTAILPKFLGFFKTIVVDMLRTKVL